SRILINDLDPQLGAFWRSVLQRPDDFVSLLYRTRPSVAEWRRQREVYQRPSRYSDLRVGFATFFLNRCNRSGIIATGGPIGGIKQRGKWDIRARWGVAELEKRIRRIAAYRERVEFYQMDARDFLREQVLPRSDQGMF